VDATVRSLPQRISKTKEMDLTDAAAKGRRSRCLLFSADPIRGLVILRQTFVRRCQRCVTWAASYHSASKPLPTNVNTGFFFLPQFYRRYQEKAEGLGP
jgi:hypothetical protein